MQLENGEILKGRCVLANTDPKRTFLKLIDRDQLDPEFARDIQQIRMGHSSLRVNLALKGLPDIRFFAPAKKGHGTALISPYFRMLKAWKPIILQQHRPFAEGAAPAYHDSFHGR